MVRFGADNFNFTVVTGSVRALRRKGFIFFTETALPSWVNLFRFFFEDRKALITIRQNLKPKKFKGQITLLQQVKKQIKNLDESEGLSKTETRARRRRSRSRSIRELKATQR